MKLQLIYSILLCCSLSWANGKAKHEQWTNVLKKYTQEKNQQVLVNYQAIKKNINDLNLYLKQLEQINTKDFNKLNKKEKLAFWINAYNAYTVQLIVDHYPVQSIKDINAGWFKGGPWKKKFIKLLGNSYSLDNIEHDIIRKDFAEPRIHFAVNCASIGCPSLFQEAFIAEKLDEQLNQAAKHFLSNQNKNQIKDNTMQLSKIFKWYGGDFEKQYGNYQQFIIQTLGLEKKNYSVDFLDYDWSLNETK
ncbi:MAG TPA: DUF547 domain-containing protein [Oligoflexia bacterium]|nr:DUF547 domain-containing protein [Oligoflexia bacterium]HMR25064.1 DUF547 domain-containing protein [Oligoflexia bacterium]